MVLLLRRHRLRPVLPQVQLLLPSTAALCLNGNEYAQRRAGKAGIGHTALDNGFATCDDPCAVRAICDGLSAEKIDALLRKWLRLLPHPFTGADQQTGYRSSA